MLIPWLVYYALFI